MAKKTVKVDLKSAGAEPAAGDVNISYKGTRIAGLSESSTAILETENTIVQDDIEVEYTKPARITLPTLNLTVPNDFRGNLHDIAIITDIDGNMVVNPVFLGPSGQYQFIPEYDESFDKYAVYGVVGGVLDDWYNVTLNGNNIAYSSEEPGYIFEAQLESYTDTITLIIADK